MYIEGCRKLIQKERRSSLLAFDLEEQHLYGGKARHKHISKRMVKSFQLGMNLFLPLKKKLSFGLYATSNDELANTTSIKRSKCSKLYLGIP